MPDTNLDNLSTAELMAMLYDPQQELEKAGSPAAPAQITRTQTPLDVQQYNANTNPLSRIFGQRKPPTQEERDAESDRLRRGLIQTGGVLAGEGLFSPAMSMGEGPADALLGAIKGIGLNEAVTRGTAAATKQPQPAILDPSQLSGDALGGFLGGLGGFYRAPAKPAPPTKADVFKVWQQDHGAWQQEHNALVNNALDARTATDTAKNEHDLLQPDINDVNRQIRRQEDALKTIASTAKGKAKEAFHNSQANLRLAAARQNQAVKDAGQRVINLKQAVQDAQNFNAAEGKVQTGISGNDLNDRILAEQKSLDDLRANPPQADNDLVDKLDDVIDRATAKIEKGEHYKDELGRFRGANRAIEDRTKAQELKDAHLQSVEDALAEHTQKINDQRAKIRELQASKSQAGKAGVGTPEGNSRLQSAIQAYRDGVADQQQQQSRLQQIRTSTLQHAVNGMPNADPAENSEYVAGLKNLNALQDKENELFLRKSDLFKTWKRNEAAAKAANTVVDKHTLQKPVKPPEPEKPNILGDMLKRYVGRTAATGGIPGVLVEEALRHANVPPTFAIPAGTAAGGIIGAVAGTPEFQQAAKGAPVMIAPFASQQR